MGDLRSSEEEVPAPPSFFRSIFDPFFGAEDRRLKIRGFFDLRLRRSKIEDRGVLRSSGPKIEDGGFFDLRLRRTKMGDLRPSNPKIED